MKLPEEVRDAFALDLAAKFMATVDAEGVPNIAPIITIYPWEEEDELIFGDFLMWKTKENLLRVAESPISMSVMTEDFQSFEVRGRFLGFEAKGPKFDYIGNKDLFRYSAIGLLRSVGTMTVDEVHVLPMGRINVVMDWLTTRLAARRPKSSEPGTPVHPVVRNKVGVLMGAKFLAVVREDRVVQFPVLCLQPAGEDYVAFGTKTVREQRKSLTPGDQVAISVFTLDPQAYQLKGVFTGFRQSRGFEMGYVRVTSVWTQVPPIPGAQITYNE